MIGFKRALVLGLLAWALQHPLGWLWYPVAAAAAAVALFTIATYDHGYWRRRGVFSPPAWPLVGHILPVVLFKEQGGMCFKRIYDTYKNERFLGTHQFYQRTLVVRDPELIKRVCVHDFQHFVDRGFFFNADVDPLAGSVLFLRGNEWKRLRAKISPIFSPNKLRGMFPLIENTANEFVQRVKKLIDNNQTNILNADYNKTGKIAPKDLKMEMYSKGVNVEKKDLLPENENSDSTQELLNNVKTNGDPDVMQESNIVLEESDKVLKINSYQVNAKKELSVPDGSKGQEYLEIPKNYSIEIIGNNGLSRESQKAIRKKTLNNKILEHFAINKEKCGDSEHINSLLSAVKGADKDVERNIEAYDKPIDENIEDTDYKICKHSEQYCKTNKVVENKQFIDLNNTKTANSDGILKEKVTRVLLDTEFKEGGNLKDSTVNKIDNTTLLTVFEGIERNIKSNEKYASSLLNSESVIANGILQKTKFNKENTENIIPKINHFLEQATTTSLDDKIARDNSDVESVLVDSEKLVGGYTADAIVPCAFGLKSSVMDNENDPFAVALHAFYEMSWFNIFEKTMRQFWPAFVLFFRMRIIPKKTHDFFHNIVTSVLRARENGEQEKRGDFIDMMMTLRSDERNNNSVCPEDDVEISKFSTEVSVTTTALREQLAARADMVISANAFIIFLGGFETTSSTLAFLLLELAANPGVQERLRTEIHQVLARHGGDVTYEVLQEMSYMETVIQETLRLYPPFPSIQRMCTKDYTIPGSNVVVEKGTIVLFPTLGIQRDEQYFENAGAFAPERWSGSQLPPPGVYMPFGDGPRYCIGKRFALIQMKCCLIRLLQHVRFSPAGDVTRTEPFPADPRSPLTLHPADSRVRISLL